jgi:ribosomal protein S18 acetylase RimI-like enzyme
VNGDPAGYTMLVFGEPSDDDVSAAVSVHPIAELSKVYVLEGHHGAGVGAALMAASLAAARERAVAGVWLGVNQQNARANRFYEKSGFAIVGEKKFLVGGKTEDDFVRQLVF